MGGGILDFLKTALGGIAVGVIVGYALSFLAGHPKLGHFRAYAALMMITAALGAYLLGDLLHVSGFMATFAAGLIWGNAICSVWK